jgi:hypothetical protein
MPENIAKFELSVMMLLFFWLERMPEIKLKMKKK